MLTFNAFAIYFIFRAPIFYELYESITNYIGIDTSESPVFMRVLKTFIKIYGDL